MPLPTTFQPCIVRKDTLNSDDFFIKKFVDLPLFRLTKINKMGNIHTQYTNSFTKLL